MCLTCLNKCVWLYKTTTTSKTEKIFLSPQNFLLLFLLVGPFVLSLPPSHHFSISCPYISDCHIKGAMLCGLLRLPHMHKALRLIHAVSSVSQLLIPFHGGAAFSSVLTIHRFGLGEIYFKEMARAWQVQTLQRRPGGWRPREEPMLQLEPASSLEAGFARQCFSLKAFTCLDEAHHVMEESLPNSKPTNSNGNLIGRIVSNMHLK